MYNKFGDKMFNDSKSCINFIESLNRNEQKRELSHVKEALKLLNNPQLGYKLVHVTGTNGKGSVVCFLKNILLEDGFSVGTFTSPYIIKFNERITYNDNYITDDELVYMFNMVYDVYNKMDYKLTFFEFITVMSFVYFKHKKVNYAIVEVGIGGLLDPTNAVNYDLSIITNISYDHMNYLGNTLEEIALNKLGILKENGHLITMLDKDLKYLFLKDALSKNATVKFIDKDDIYLYNCEMTSFEYGGYIYDLNMIGLHQAYNATLAIEAALYLVDIKMAKIKKGLEETFFPGRMERCLLKPRVIIDGAHNVGGMKALIDSIKVYYKNRKITFIYSAFKDKDTKGCLNIIDEVASDIVFTCFDNPRVKDPNLFVSETKKECIVINDYKEAIDKTIAKSSENDVIIITGSLYFISVVRGYLRK